MRSHFILHAPRKIEFEAIASNGRITIHDASGNTVDFLVETRDDLRKVETSLFHLQNEISNAIKRKGEQNVVSEFRRKRSDRSLRRVAREEADHLPQID